MRDEDLVERFSYETPPEGPSQSYESLRQRAFRLAVAVDLHCPDCVEKHFALRRLNECVEWANLGISRHRAAPLPVDEPGRPRRTDRDGAAKEVSIHASRA